MNRILFEPHEITADHVVTFAGARAEHVMTVLHGEVGQTLKTGVLDGLVGTSVIEAIQATAEGFAITARCTHDTPSPQPWVDLVLAPPRPRILKRLLPQLSALGVGRITLVGAQKVEKDFWGATLLKEEIYRPFLVDGLMQAGTSIVPTLEVRRNLRKFMAEELSTAGYAPIIAHPYGAGAVPSRLEGAGRKLLLAIGPEGGWTETEVALFEAQGFVRYSLGARILRTDTATVALLAQLMKEFDA